MIRFNANLFRIAMLGASNEETRYYLRGVFVEPHHAKGVTLTTTDGHKMICIHDESGHADESAIITLGAVLKSCKPKRGQRIDVVIETGAMQATVVCAVELGSKGAVTLQDTPIAVAYDVRIDGSFPDYRRVIGKSFANTLTPTFASQYLGHISDIGIELAVHFHSFNVRGYHGQDRKDAMHICAADCEGADGAPALVTWPFTPQAFAVLMPCRNKDISALPAWYSSTPPAAAAV